MRIDNFVSTHVEYLNGRFKIAAAKSVQADLDLSENINERVDEATGVIEDDPEETPENIDVERNDTDCPEMLATREVENWGGLSVHEPQSQQSRYLAPANSSDLVLHKKLMKIPILKNGGNVDLKGIKVGKQSISLTNTCAFDSIFHCFLTMFLDLDDVKTTVLAKSGENMFFQLVANVGEKGINKSSYKLRALILINSFFSDKLENLPSVIPCETTVGYLYKTLFKELPSFEETSKCNEGCPVRKINLQIIQINEEAILAEDSNAEIEKQIIFRKSRPCAAGCSNGLENVRISKTGK